MKIHTHLLAGIAAFAMCLATAQADIVLNMPDDPDVLGSSGSLSSYHDYEWGGWSYAADGGDYYVYPTGSGAVTITRTDERAFNYDGAYFADLGTLPDAGSVTITGYLGSVEKGSVTLNGLTDTYLDSTARIEGVDRLVLLGTDWKMKELNDLPTEVPEPTTILAGALLLLPFAAGTLRSIRRARR